MTMSMERSSQEAFPSGFGGIPSYLLPVKNTFIDWPSAEPPPLELEKHVSCPAAFDFGADRSCTDSNTEGPGLPTCVPGAALWRLNGEALEVNFDGLESVADARCRAAAVLDVSLHSVCLIGADGRALDDCMQISGLKVEDLQLMVSSDPDVEASRTSQQFASLVGAECSDTRIAEIISTMDLNSHDELALAISDIVHHACSDTANSEICFNLLLALKAHWPTCAGSSTNTGKQVSFTRVLLGVCQSEYEAALENFAIAQGVANSSPAQDALTRPVTEGLSEEEKQRCVLLFSFFGDLFARDFLAWKVVREIISDLLGGQQVVPAPLSLECAYRLLQSVCPILATRNIGKAYLSQLWTQLSELQRAPGRVEARVLPWLQQLLDFIKSSQTTPRAVL